MSSGFLELDIEGDPAFSDDVPFEARARFERDRGSQTRRWREMDSNHRSPLRFATVFETRLLSPS
jgi:hypothetical protein